jgi:cellulose synthase/poly-beta-1,6-N-acetylglucosamine synthase-like glycosyltransferase
MWIECVFWTAVLVLAYIYVGYPFTIATLARLFPRPVKKGPITPTITILIPAHNEERRIARKIENCLALTYPPDRVTILVISDGSTDRTAKVAQEYASRFPDRIGVVSIPTRQGKPNALNIGAGLATGEILLLADVRQSFDPLAAQALVRNLADPTVGAVSGELFLGTDDRTALRGLGLYWRYEKALRYAESRFRTCTHYTGAISAVRRSLFTPLPKETLHDDVVMPLRVAATGYRVIFEPAAHAFDTISPSPAREFSRKVRTLAAAFQTVLHFRRFVEGRVSLLLWWQFGSHAALRLVLPYALIALLISSALLTGSGYRLLLAAQCTGYGLGVIGLWGVGGARWTRVLSLPSTFLMLNVAALLGPLFYLAGRHLDLWRMPAPEVCDA